MANYAVERAIDEDSVPLVCDRSARLCKSFRSFKKEKPYIGLLDLVMPTR